jgi:hypothetical protein
MPVAKAPSPSMSAAHMPRWRKKRARRRHVIDVGGVE